MYNHSPEASRACCKFADSGPKAVEELELMLYRRLVPGSDGCPVVGKKPKCTKSYDSQIEKTLGVGLLSSNGDIVPLVLIESDEYGIHFTGRVAYDPSRCLLACLRKSVDIHPIIRHIIYLDFLRNLQDRSATFIWDWWKSGADMDRLDRVVG
ncbi:hypothetical protein RhiLY_09320 [Ceratobasidium sp. AG-Ba]|nr:hypothetical protein RhiLY_09320 [Ceratobasidium sp. AG-Ba]